METNDLVINSSEDAVTIKGEPYFVCLEDNWIIMETEDLVMNTPILASTKKDGAHYDTILPSASGEHIEPDLPIDPGTYIPKDELTIKDEPSTEGEYFEPDSPLIKIEPLESKPTELFSPLSHQLWREHRPDPEGSGNMVITIRETSTCRNTPYTGWHLLRATGLMTLLLRSKNLNCENLVRLAIKRKNPEYSSFPIDRVCVKHQADASFDLDHVLQPGPNEQNWMFQTVNREKSLVYFLDKHQTSRKLEVRIICNDTCRTSTDKNFKSKEKSRDIVLEVTVEAKDNKTILEREFIQVWTKAAIKISDLEKKVRRENKGSVAIKEKRERLLALKDPKARTKAGSIIKRAYAALKNLDFSDKEILLMTRKEAAKHQ